MCCSSAVCTAVAVVVRLVLLVCSCAGWIVFAVGFRQVFEWAQAQQAFMYITTPHWVFVVSAVPLYVTLLVHTFLSKWKDNAGHITLAVVNFFRMFYLIGAGGTIAVTALLLALRTFDSQHHVKLVLVGCGVSVLFYWISEIVWPLLQLRKKSQPINEEEEEMIESFMTSTPSPFQQYTPPHPTPYTQIKESTSPFLQYTPPHPSPYTQSTSPFPQYTPPHPSPYTQSISPFPQYTPPHPSPDTQIKE